MRFLPGNAQHIGARRSQQDSFGFSDPADTGFVQHGGFLAVVCDGMGGMEHGDLAGRTAVRAFLESYARKMAHETVPAALERSAREANARVVALAHSLGRAEGVGTTLVAATVLDAGPGQARLYWVSVGDSGLFHVSGGQIRMVNRPHVYANHLDLAVARGTLSAEIAMMHPERESLTSYIGGELLEEIDLTVDPLLIGEGDTILLASDGMFKTLSAAEITACLSGDPQEWPDTLVNQTLARRREGQDNVTVLSVTVEAEPIQAASSGGFPLSAEFSGLPKPVEPQWSRTLRLPSHGNAESPEGQAQPPAPTPAFAAGPNAAGANAAGPGPSEPSTGSSATGAGATGPSPGDPGAVGPSAVPAPPSQPAPPPQPPEAGLAALLTPMDGSNLVTAEWAAPPQAIQEAQSMPGAQPIRVANPAAPPMPSVAASAAPARSLAWVWALSAILVLGAAGGGWWYWSHRDQPATQQTHPGSGSSDTRSTPSSDPKAPEAPIKPADAGQGGK